MQLQQGFAMRGIGLNCHFAGQQFSTADVRYGSKADISEKPADVRFTPNSGHRLSAPDVRFVPTADIMPLCMS
jgi:hypothetical protein